MADDTRYKIDWSNLENPENVGTLRYRGFPFVGPAREVAKKRYQVLGQQAKSNLSRSLKPGYSVSERQKLIDTKKQLLDALEEKLQSPDLLPEERQFFAQTQQQKRLEYEELLRSQEIDTKKASILPKNAPTMLGRPVGAPAPIDPAIPPMLQRPPEEGEPLLDVREVQEALRQGATFNFSLDMARDLIRQMSAPSEWKRLDEGQYTEGEIEVLRALISEPQGLPSKTQPTVPGSMGVGQLARGLSAVAQIPLTVLDTGFRGVDKFRSQWARNLAERVQSGDVEPSEILDERMQIRQGMPEMGGMLDTTEETRSAGMRKSDVSPWDYIASAVTAVPAGVEAALTKPSTETAYRMYELQQAVQSKDPEKIEAAINATDPNIAQTFRKLSVRYRELAERLAEQEVPDVLSPSERATEVAELVPEIYEALVRNDTAAWSIQNPETSRLAGGIIGDVLLGMGFRALGRGITKSGLGAAISRNRPGKSITDYVPQTSSITDDALDPQKAERLAIGMRTAQDEGVARGQQYAEAIARQQRELKRAVPLDEVGKRKPAYERQLTQEEVLRSPEYNEAARETFTEGLKSGALNESRAGRVKQPPFVENYSPRLKLINGETVQEQLERKAREFGFQSKAEAYAFAKRWDPMQPEALMPNGQPMSPAARRAFLNTTKEGNAGGPVVVREDAQMRSAIERQGNDFWEYDPDAIEQLKTLSTEAGRKVQASATLRSLNQVLREEGAIKVFGKSRAGPARTAVEKTARKLERIDKQIARAETNIGEARELKYDKLSEQLLELEERMHKEPISHWLDEPVDPVTGETARVQYDELFRELAPRGGIPTQVTPERATQLTRKQMELEGVMSRLEDAGKKGSKEWRRAKYQYDQIERELFPAENRPTRSETAQGFDELGQMERDELAWRGDEPEPAKFSKREYNKWVSAVEKLQKELSKDPKTKQFVINHARWKQLQKQRTHYEERFVDQVAYLDSELRKIPELHNTVAALSARDGFEYVALGDRASKEWLRATRQVGEATTGEIVIVPRGVAEMMQQLIPLYGEIPTWSFGKLYNNTLGAINEIFRPSATLLSGLQYYATNLIGNGQLLVLARGVKALNPQINAASLAASVMALLEPHHALPGAVAKARQIPLKLGTDQTTLGAILDQAKRFGIVRQIQQELALNIQRTSPGNPLGMLANLNRRLAAPFGAVAQGTDDFFRLHIFMAGIERHGMTDAGIRRAVELVNEMTGNFGRTTKFDELGAPIFAFWKWQKFAWPRYFKAIAQHPERINIFRRINAWQEQRNGKEHPYPSEVLPEFLKQRGAYTAAPEYQITDEQRKRYIVDPDAFIMESPETPQALGQMSADYEAALASLTTPSLSGAVWFIFGYDPDLQKRLPDGVAVSDDEFIDLMWANPEEAQKVKEKLRRIFGELGSQGLSSTLDFFTLEINPAVEKALQARQVMWMLENGLAPNYATALAVNRRYGVILELARTMDIIDEGLELPQDAIFAPLFPQYVVEPSRNAVRRLRDAVEIQQSIR